MTTPHSVSLPQQTPPLQTRSLPHEHGWIVESRHWTSEGQLLYVRCVGCGVRRIDILHEPETPPAALSRETPPAEHRRADYDR